MFPKETHIYSILLVICLVLINNRDNKFKFKKYNYIFNKCGNNKYKSNIYLNIIDARSIVFMSIRISDINSVAINFVWQSKFTNIIIKFKKKSFQTK